MCPDIVAGIISPLQMTYGLLQGPMEQLTDMVHTGMVDTMAGTSNTFCTLSHCFERYK